MNNPSKATGTDVPKSDKQLPEKDQKPRMTAIEKLEAKKLEVSALIIQRAWFIHVDKTIFQLLKHTICAAEQFVAHEILKTVSPIEAKLVKDPSMKCKVRFRFNGETFPPFIVFKIFLHGDGSNNKYFSGKNLLKPSSKAVLDACNIMGKRKFHQQIMEDDRLFQESKIADQIDIVTMQDYLQYSSLMDETPASSGGRNNQWRKLNLRNIPKTMMIYDIVHYAETGAISKRLQEEMKYLLQKPRTVEMRQHQLQIVSEIRYPSFHPVYRPYKQQNKMKHLGRRSKQAQMKVEKMKNAYMTPKEPKASKATTEPQKDTQSTKKQEMIVISTSSLDIVKVKDSTSDSEFEKEEKELFAWYQDLYVDYSSLLDTC